MKKYFKKFSIMLCVLTLILVSGCNKQEVVEQPSETVEEQMVGGWEERVDQEVTEELLGIFNKGVKGTEYESWVPVKLLATQVVAGMNFKFLCDNEKELVIYQNPNKEYIALNEDGSVAERSVEEAPTVMLTREEVLEIALADAEVQEPRFVEISLDKERESLVYEVDFEAGENEYEYDIDAFTGNVISRGSKVDNEAFSILNTKEHEVVDDTALNDAAIKEIVFADAGVSEENIQFLRIEREYDDGIKQAEVEFFADGKEYSYSLNALTGEILEFEVE